MPIRTELIEQRIDGLTVDLGPAVQSGNGARFFMLLSLIASNQTMLRPETATAGQGEFTLPPMALNYPVQDEIYSPAVAERFNQAVHQGFGGDFAYLNSYLGAVSERPVMRTANLTQGMQEPMLQAGQLMTAEVEQSRQSWIAAA
ncbi:hypothetical protein ACFVYJ_03010 [Pontibacter sp. JAM-7]|uniref:hypothetical protein n=1 Tax=Pontibacter sp. JAM-7 TaxID=3366581 RepID=UPI003AF4D720